ncbi:hypothetical protein BJ6T_09370 [Bradyrhizobium japonicum USDA 6]|nr:hypothetical protein BJ6T_09370 [Bradyrhizobium japonicum USDA 6]
MEGLYKVEYDINDGSGRSVLYAHAGKMLGGNTAFAHLGTYEIVNGEIVARLRTKRHSRSPQHRSLVSSDAVTISIRGRQQGMLYRFEGEVVEDASVFRAVMTPLGDDDVPRPVRSARAASSADSIRSTSGCWMELPVAIPA